MAISKDLSTTLCEGWTEVWDSRDGEEYEPREKHFHPWGQGTEESQAGDFPWQAPHPQP